LKAQLFKSALNCFKEKQVWKNCKKSCCTVVGN
jgi:hypothetical protein